MAYVYILYSKKTNRYYIGSTIDTEKRLIAHNRGNTKSTKSGIPWKMKFSTKLPSLKTARKLEHRLKKHKNRKILEQIITDQYISMLK